MKKIRIFLGLVEVAGYNKNLKEAFQKLGIECTFINIGEDLFQYGGSDKPNIIFMGKKWINRKSLLSKNIILKYIYLLLSCLFTFLLFFWALYRFDIFIFSAGISFFNYLDLPIIKLFGKKIIFIFFGSDSRPLYIGKDSVITEDKSTIFKYIAEISRQKRKIQKIEKYANVIIDNSPSSHFHEKKIVQWLAIGIPRKYPSVINVEGGLKTECRENLEVRILHAPSNLMVKGTEKIRESIKSLSKKGYNIKYVEITGKPHSSVIDEIKKCDFVVDQIYSDTPMATFATEAAWHGKPSVVGGYYADYILNEVSEKMIPPSLFCHPDNIHNSIEKMIVDKSFRDDLGKKAFKFVRENWESEKVAERYLKLIDGDIPEEWLYDPNNIQYLQGGGTHEQRIKNTVKKIIEYGGIESLQLLDKPELEKKFKDFAYQ